MRVITVSAALFGIFAFTIAAPISPATTTLRLRDNAEIGVDVSDGFKRSEENVGVSDGFKRSEENVDVSDGFKRSEESVDVSDGF